jgi:hypothetical protein
MSTPSSGTSAEDLVDIYTSMAARLRSFNGEVDAASAMTATVVALVPGAEYAGLTRAHSGGSLTTLGATAPLVDEVDRVQYQLGSGPCVDVLVSDRPVVARDLRSSREWPDFGRRAAELGVLSMLSYRLHLEDDEDDAGTRVLGGMNLYARRPDAFDLARVLPVIPVLASFCALAIWGGSMAEQAQKLEVALASSRDIGAAQGILMERYKVTREEAFGLLATVSQRTNRKLRDVAVQLVDTGEVPLPPPRRHRG